MSEEKKKKKLGLIPKLILAIVLGWLVGQMTFLPEIILQIPVTISDFFGSILNFFIPLMIVGYIVKGIADLTEGAGKMLAITTGLSYASSIIGGVVAYVVASLIFPLFIDQSMADQFTEAGEGLAPLFEIPVEPMFSVTAAIVFAFIFGISISWLRSKKDESTLYNFFNEFESIITYVLRGFIVPFIPIFIFGNFVNFSYAGTFGVILSVFWRVFLIVLLLHFVLLFIWFTIASLFGGKNPFTMIKNQVPGYLTALGTQSSAATIPVNLQVAKANGVSKKIRDFVIPFGATAHLLGSMVTITSVIVATLMMFGMPTDFGLMSGFLLVLGVAMVAAPGAPGGAVMSALPFLPIVGIDPSSAMANLIISLYIAQDSFGTAANISGDNAIAVVVDKIYYKYISSEPRPVEESETERTSSRPKTVTNE